jgi:cytoskeletal protein CcmA (bactofilin family)
MLFNLGKSKNPAEPVQKAVEPGPSSMEERVLERWRRLANRDEGPVPVKDLTLDREEAPPPLASAQDTGWAVATTSVTSSEDSIVRDLMSRDLQSSPDPTHDKPVRTAPADWSLPLEDDLKRRFGSDIRSALGPGTVIEGRFSFDSPVRVDGHLTGDVNSTSVLIVGAQAVVEARIRVGSIIILGRVRAEIEASDLVEVRRDGVLEGDVTCERFVIEEGGTFNGSCNIRKE